MGNSQIRRANIGEVVDFLVWRMRYTERPNSESKSGAVVAVLWL